jgi:hypothetical protein
MHVGEQCHLLIDRVFWQFQLGPNEFYYIVPDSPSCASYYIGNGKITIG